MVGRLHSPVCSGPDCGQVYKSIMEILSQRNDAGVFAGRLEYRNKKDYSMVFFRGGPFLPSRRSHKQPSFLYFTKRKDLVKLKKVSPFLYTN
jgi:hypothetical protein